VSRQKSTKGKNCVAAWPKRHFTRLTQAAPTPQHQSRQQYRLNKQGELFIL
jgi:hypothetical protein